MFKVLKELRGVGDVHAEGCYWLSVFDIDILEDLCFCFICLPASLFLCVWSAICHYHRHNFNISIWVLHAGFTDWLIDLSDNQLTTVQHKHSTKLKAYVLSRCNDHRPLHTTVWGYWYTVRSVQLFFLFPRSWFPVVPCLFCVFHIVQNVKDK